MADRTLPDENGETLGFPRSLFGYLEITEHGVEVAEGAKLVAPVILGSFSKVGSGCVVGPNVVTGEGVILEKESHIRDSVIMAHTKLEPSSDFNGILLSKNDRLDLKS